MIQRFFIAIFTLLILAQPLGAERYVPAIQKYRPTLNHERMHELSDHVVDVAQDNNLDSDLLMGLIAHETDIRNIQSQVCRNRMTGEIVPVYRCRRNPSEYRREVSCGYTQIKPMVFRKVMGYWPAGDTKIEECKTLIRKWKTTVRASARLLKKLQEQNGHLDGIGAYNCPGCSNGNRWYVYEVLGEVKVVRNHSW